MSIAPQQSAAHKGCAQCGEPVTRTGRPPLRCERCRTPAPRTRVSATERFWSKVDKAGPVALVKAVGGREMGNCWVWTAGSDRHGYGSFYYGDGTCGPAYRFSYIEQHGQPAKGLHLDHLCRRPSCVRPWHLEPVTAGENFMRGVGPQARNARKTHCVNGHEFTPENTRYYRGWRQCRTCTKIHLLNREDRLGIVRKRRTADPRQGEQ